MNFLFLLPASTALPSAEHLDPGISQQCGQPEAGLYCAALARGRRQDVRKVHGVRAGVHQESVRIGRTGRLQPDPGVPGRGLQLGGALHGKLGLRKFLSHGDRV